MVTAHQPSCLIVGLATHPMSGEPFKCRHRCSPEPACSIVWDSGGVMTHSSRAMRRKWPANCACFWHAAGEKAPFLLVAHSMAGYNARLFVSQNPKDVTGVLLLDVAHPDQNQRESQASNDDRHDFIRRQVWWARLAPFGITRIMGHCKWSPQDCARSYRTTVDEFGPFNDISPEQVRRAGNLGNIPLVVIAHDPELQIRDDPGAVTRRDAAAELEMQKELGQLSSRSCFLIAKGSRHYVQDDRPDLVVGSLKMLSSSDLGNETQIPCAGILQH